MLDPVQASFTTLLGSNRDDIKSAYQLLKFFVPKQEVGGSSFDSLLLRASNAFLGASEAARFSEPHFHKNQNGRRLQHDQVNLAPPGTIIAFYEFQALILQIA